MIYNSYDVINKKEVIVKILNHERIQKIRREIMVLQHLKKVKNKFLPEIIDFGKETSSNTYFLVFAKSKFSKNDNISLKEFLQKKKNCYDLNFVRKVMKQIIKGVLTTHKNGIIHRDLKPGNIILNEITDEIQIIDWGLAEFYHFDHKYNLRVSTRPYKCPEILIGQRKYDYSFDIWGIGCLFFCLLFKKPYFALGQNDNEQFVMLCKIFGSKEILDFAKNEKIGIKPELKNFVDMYFGKKVVWESFIDAGNIELFDKKALGLLGGFLRMDPVF